MRQAPNNLNNQNNEKQNKDVAIGAMSVTSLLKELANNKDSLTYTFQQVFVPKAIEFFNISSSLINVFNKQRNLFNNLSGITANIDITNILLNKIAETLDTFFNGKVYNSIGGDGNKATPASKEIVTFLKKDDFSQTILTEIYSVLWTVIDLQQSVITLISKIYTYLPELKPATSKTSAKAVAQSTKEYIEFLNTLERLDKVISKDFINRFKTLTDEYVKFIDKKNTTALIVCGVQLTRFSWVLFKLAGVLVYS